MEYTLLMTKYPLLDDVEWLKAKYEIENLSCKEIGKLVGCTKDGVRVALIRNKICLRTATETNKIIFDRTGGESQYDLLNDENWLRQKYEVDGLSTSEIAELVGAKTSNSVCQALRRKNIKVRHVSDGLTYKRRMKELDGCNFIFNTDVIVGCLLGDAGLIANNRQSDFSNPHFYKKNINYDHILWIASLLFKDGGKFRIKEDSQITNAKLCKCFSLHSFTDKNLFIIYREWYPPSNNYKKLVPRNIQINETVLLHWFLDDGCSSWRKREGKMTKQVILVFCSESFIKEDQEWLCNKINKEFNLNATLIKTTKGSGWRIKIPQSKVEEFFDIIGPCPEEIPSMRYKWKIPE